MKVLVIGCGQNVRSELDQIDRADFDKVIGVNRAAELFGPVDIHISLHPAIYAKKKQAYFVSFVPMPGVDEVFDYVWPEAKSDDGHRSGSSGLYAVKYALERLDCQQVVLAGVGMDSAPHVYNNCAWKQAEGFRHTWEKVYPRLAGKVVSLGGFTRELLGTYNPPRNVATHTKR